jgi:hypothetical protein
VMHGLSLSIGQNDVLGYLLFTAVVRGTTIQYGTARCSTRGCFQL